MTIKCAYVPYSYIEYAEKDAAQKLKGYCALTFHVCGLQMKKKKLKINVFKSEEAIVEFDLGRLL